MGDWTEDMPDDLSEPLRNIESATTQMLRAVDEGRYLTAPEHIRADLMYLRGEARRAARYATTAGPGEREGGE